MTMKLTIKNEDAARVAVADVQEFQIGKVVPVREDQHRIEPGATLEVWIHASKQVVIREAV